MNEFRIKMIEGEAAETYHLHALCRTCRMRTEVRYFGGDVPGCPECGEELEDISYHPAHTIDVSYELFSSRYINERYAG